MKERFSDKEIAEIIANNDKLLSALKQAIRLIEAAEDKNLISRQAVVEMLDTMIFDSPKNEAEKTITEVMGHAIKEIQAMPAGGGG